ncbi:MAG: DegT/DnrJ/EryC1/StrS family aminotransferase [Cyanobacteria bacterium P01_D01_bin.36]
MTSTSQPTKPSSQPAISVQSVASYRQSSDAIVKNLEQLISELPTNSLALFGQPPVRSQPYPEWPVFDERDVAAVANVVLSGQWGGIPSPGSHAETFAHQFVSMQCGSDQKRDSCAVLVANGSLTLEVALRAANIGWGDEVIVPAYTFQATAAAPITAGAIPIIVDIDPETYCISPAAIEAAISPKTKAIIPVHLGAQMADMDAIMDIAQRHNLIVIEDCAHAHGAQWNGQGAGTIGHFGSFSLQSNKILTTGEGGVLLCRTQDLAARAESIVNCGRLPQATSTETLSNTPPASALSEILTKFIHFNGQEPAFSMGTNYRMTQFQAALGSIALERFSAQVEAREAMLNYLELQLPNVPGIRVLNPQTQHTKRSFYRYIFAIDPAIFGVVHNEVCLALQSEGIPCSTGYPAMHRYSLFQPQRSRLPVPSIFPERFDLESMRFPEAERACEQEAIWLDESVFRAGKQGIDDVIASLLKVQQQSATLAAAKAAFLERMWP